MMRHIKRQWRRILVFLLLFVYIFSAGGEHSAHAAASASGASEYFHIALDTEGKPVGLAIVAFAPGKGVFAYTMSNEKYGDEPNAILYSVTERQPYEMKFREKLAGLYSWEVVGLDPSDGGNSGILYAEAPVNGETVQIYYPTIVDDSLTYVCDTRTIAGIKQMFNDGTAYISLSDRLPDLKSLPGFLINGNGNCVGILNSYDIAYVDWFDESVFGGDVSNSSTEQGDNGGSEQGGSGENEPGDNGGTEQGGSGENEPGDNGGTEQSGSGENEPGDSGSKSGIDNPTDLPSRDDGDLAKQLTALRKQLEEEQKRKRTIIIAAVAAVIAIGTVAAILLIRNRKPNGSKVSGNRDNAGYGPTQPLPSEGSSVQQPTMFLSCRGGYMDGRVFPIAGTVTIGRDASCTIRYPVDYAGVSRNHATLRFDNGMLTLCDTSSTGTLLKRLQTKIPPGNPIQVSVGDIFYIGERKNRFEVVTNR